MSSAQVFGTADQLTHFDNTPGERIPEAAAGVVKPTEGVSQPAVT